MILLQVVTLKLYDRTIKKEVNRVGKLKNKQGWKKYEKRKETEKT